MKLSDVTHVKRLSGERDYLKALLSHLRDVPRIHIGSHDLRPDLSRKVYPAVAEAIRAEIERVDNDLAGFGVQVDEGAGA